MKKLICIEERIVNDLLLRIERSARIARQLLQQAEHPTAENWMDNEAVCRRLNISKRTLQYYRENGSISFTTIEGKTLYRVKDVDDFLSERTVECK